MTFLYKYRSFSSNSDRKRLYDIIDTQRFWFARGIEVNDPFEFKCAIDFGWRTPDTIKAFTIVELSQNPHMRLDDATAKVARVLSKVPAAKLRLRQHELAEEIWQRLGHAATMCCFAGTPLSILMWSHYAAGHTGVCIEVDCSEISEYVYPIDYSDSPPSISPLSLMHVETGKSNDLFESLFLRKATCWSYEAESRIMRIAKNFDTKIRSHDDTFGHGSIRRVIVGAAMTPENRVMLVKHIRAKAPKIGIGFAIPNPEGPYAIRIVDETEFGV